MVVSFKIQMTPGPVLKFSMKADCLLLFFGGGGGEVRVISASFLFVKISTLNFFYRIMDSNLAYFKFLSV